MRRNAICLAASLLILVALPGCGLSKKREADAQTQVDTADLYTSTPEEEPLREYDPYAVDTSSLYAAGPPPTLTDDDYGTTPAARYHTVAKNDTLYHLARVYYSDQRRWKDIYEANRSQIGDPNKIRIGQRLVIP